VKRPATIILGAGSIVRKWDVAARLGAAEPRSGGASCRARSIQLGPLCLLLMMLVTEAARLGVRVPHHGARYPALQAES
jgi:hypothetical protein